MHDTFIYLSGNNVAKVILRLLTGCATKTMSIDVFWGFPRLEGSTKGIGGLWLFYGCSYMFHLSGNNRRDSHFMGS